jgi:hypothetical protein
MPTAYIGPMAPMKAPDALRPDHKRGPSLMVRLRVRIKRLELDSELAKGANPERSEERALRAKQLQDRTTRERLAAGIENLFRLATMGPGPDATVSIVRAPFDGYRVAANRSGLAELAEKLRRPEPPDVRAVAMASVLLEDDRSPLYSRNATDELKPAIRAASSAFDR